MQLRCVCVSSLSERLMRNARMQGLKIEEVVPPVCPQAVADGNVTLVGTRMASKSAVISLSCPSRSTVLRGIRST